MGNDNLYSDLISGDSVKSFTRIKKGCKLVLIIQPSREILLSNPYVSQKD